MLSTEHDLSGLPDPNIDKQFYDGVPFKRLLAWGIDFAIIIVLAIISVIASFGLGAFAFPLLLFCINVGYRIFMLYNSSATIGMRLAGIEIRNRRGDRLDLSEAAWHTGLYTLVAISVLALAFSMIMMMINSRKQGLHDYFLGTTAINRPHGS